jgi:hypothetical protein
MIFVGGSWHGRDEDVGELTHWKVQTSQGQEIYTLQTFALPGVGWGKVMMVHPVYDGAPRALCEALKGALLERWLREGSS